MTTILSDIRFGVRMLVKNPAITIIALLALTLGIGANTAIFSVVNAVLLRSMPYGDAEKLVLVWEKKKSAPTDQNVINIGNYSDWKEQNKVFSDMAAFADTTANFTGAGEPEEIPSQIATGNLFSLLGTNALLGRTFTEEDANNESPVIVISYGLWQRRFGGSPQIVGQKIQLNNQEHVVIGVLPEEFGWHIQKGSLTNKSAELWQPWRVTPEMRTRTGRFASAVARLRPGVSVAQAQAEMDSIGARLEAERKTNTNWGVNVVPLRTQFTGDIRQPLLILLGAVGFVLLIACANVANLLLARASARRKEIAVRVGLGASRLRIVRQLLTESLLLSIVGGALGIGLAWWGTRALIYLSPPSLVELRNVNVSLPVLGFTFGLALLTGLVFGLVPALEASRFNLQGSLKEGGKNIGGSSYSHRFRNLFAVVQVALALVLLVGAGLLVKSLRHLQSVDPGFNSSNLLTMRISLPSKRYDTDEKKLDFFRRATEQLQTLPGVQSVGSINSLPFTGLHSATSVHVDGTPVRPAGQELKTGVCITDRTYFQTMQIPLKQGRLFTAQEASEMRHVVVINEAFARVNLPGEDPIGKRLLINMKADKVPTEIIGVVGDNKHMGLDLEVKPMAYWPQPELVYPGMTYVVRSNSDPSSLAPSARSIIHGLDPLQPVAEVNTMEKLLSKSVARSRFSATLLAVFSGVALVMAVVGIYGVMSYSVVQRTHEIGVRIALGAQRSDVLRLIVLRGVVLGLVGVGVGLAASFGLTRLLSSLLFDVKPTDVFTYAAVAVGLFLITLVACYVPARRATKVDPLKALRYE